MKGECNETGRRTAERKGKALLPKNKTKQKQEANKRVPIEVSRQLEKRRKKTLELEDCINLGLLLLKC